MNGNNNIIQKYNIKNVKITALELNIFQKNIKKFIENKNIITNIYRIQAYNEIICGYFCIGFIDSILKGKNFLDYSNLFSPNDYRKNDKLILKYFQ